MFLHTIGRQVDFELRLKSCGLATWNGALDTSTCSHQERPAKFC